MPRAENFTDVSFDTFRSSYGRSQRAFRPLSKFEKEFAKYEQKTLKHSYFNFGNKKGSSIEEDVGIATDNVRNHEFFSSINFEELQEGNLESPYNPQV